jgi:hypothetical protein
MFMIFFFSQVEIGPTWMRTAKRELLQEIVCLPGLPKAISWSCWQQVAAKYGTYFPIVQLSFALQYTLHHQGGSS